MSTFFRGRAMLVALLATGAGFVIAPAAASAHQRAPNVRVMTRNMYIGADLARIVQARSVAQFVAATAETYNTILASDPPERSKALAREIADADPMILGLQEVALLHQDTVAPTDDGPATPATTVVFDFLQLLTDALAAQGTPYAVVTSVTNTSAELPTALGFDVKLTDRDVLLAKARVPSDELSWTHARSANFSPRLTVATPAGQLAFLRGYNVADFTARKRSFRLVNTHLEASSNVIRTAQATELLSRPLRNTRRRSRPRPEILRRMRRHDGRGTKPRTGRKHVLLGDINSDPRESGANPYDVFASAGFADSWRQANPSRAGLTCCFGERLLDDDASGFSSRIDVVLTRNGAGPAVAARIHGRNTGNRTPSGRWPSDHAGVDSTISP